MLSMKATVAAVVAVSMMAIAPETTVAQVPPDKAKARAARPAAPARAARQAPRAAARAAAPRPAARAPARHPATVQRARPQRPAVVQRTPQQRAVQREAVRERPRQAQPKQVQPSAPKQVEPKQVERQGRERPQSVSRVQATDQQRREVRQRLFRERGADRVSGRQVNVRLAVGNRIPRHHRRHVHRFTPALLALVPLYAAYSYIIVDDTICVVEPDTYTIVDVIPGSIEQAGPTERQPFLALSASQMRCVYDSTPKDVARTDVRVRLALGAEIPPRVELFRFPEGAVACAPELAGLRYVVVDDDVVVVDPTDRAVALVIPG